MIMGGCIINVLKNSNFKKKCGQKWDQNFEKFIFRKFIYNKFNFFYIKFECRMFPAFI